MKSSISRRLPGSSLREREPRRGRRRPRRQDRGCDPRARSRSRHRLGLDCGHEQKRRPLRLDVPGLGPDSWPGEGRRRSRAAHLSRAARFLIAGALMIAWAGRDALAVPRSAFARARDDGADHQHRQLRAPVLGRRSRADRLGRDRQLRDDSGLLAARQPLARGRADRPSVTSPRSRLAASASRSCSRRGALGAPRRGARGCRRAVGLAAIALSARLLYCVGAVLSRPIATTDAGPRARGLADADRRHRPVAVSLALEPVGARHLRVLATWPTLPALLSRRRRLCSRASRSTCGYCATGAPFAPGSTPSSAR